MGTVRVRAREDFLREILKGGQLVKSVLADVPHKPDVRE